MPQGLNVENVKSLTANMQPLPAAQEKQSLVKGTPRSQRPKTGAPGTHKVPRQKATPERPEGEANANPKKTSKGPART